MWLGRSSVPELASAIAKTLVEKKLIDPGKVNVRFSGLAGPEDLIYVASADACDPVTGGWYYDVDPAQAAPSTVRVCEATCRRFAIEGGGMVELRFGCRSRIE